MAKLVGSSAEKNDFGKSSSKPCSKYLVPARNHCARMTKELGSLWLPVGPLLSHLRKTRIATNGRLRTLVADQQAEPIDSRPTEKGRIAMRPRARINQLGCHATIAGTTAHQQCDALTRPAICASNIASQTDD